MTRLRAHLERLRREESGFTLIELVTVMAMMLIVMAAVTEAMIAANKTEEDLNRRFGSQVNARIALDQLRREIHCASAVTPTGSSATITITLGSRCPTAGAGTTVSWCTSGSGSRYGLYRLVGYDMQHERQEGSRLPDRRNGLLVRAAVDLEPGGPLGHAARQHESRERPPRLPARGRHRPAELVADMTLVPRKGHAGARERAFTATGSPIKELGVPDRPASRSRRALGDERGLALPMALGVTMVLAALAAAIFTYVTMNEQSARRAGADQRAYGLAETGLSYAFSRLRNTSDPTNASAVPSTTVSLTGGSTTYSGSLSGTTWTLTSSGTVTNPTGPSAASVVRTVSTQAQVVTTTQADMRPWDYLFIDQPAGCITMGNSVSMDISLYVRGNLCLDNNSQIDSSVVNVLGSVSVYNSAQIGSPGAPISEFSATGPCSYSGATTSCGPPARIYAASVGTSPPVIPKPTVDLPYWYANAQLGPQSRVLVGILPRRLRQRHDAERRAGARST